MQGEINFYLAALMPSTQVRPTHFSTYIFDINNGAQAQQRPRNVLKVYVHFHQLNPYIQPFRSPKEWAL